MKKKLYVHLLCILFFSAPLYSQVDHGYLIDKYWYYRQRLKYFVDEGTNGSLPGEGMVAGIRNKQSSDLISYGDQMVHFGYYLGVLATEYALLTYYGQDASATLDELNIALNCYVRVDECEDNPPWNQPFALYDGFHMRQDVPSSFLQNHAQLNEGLTSADNVAAVDPGSPAWVEHVSANSLLNWDVNPGGSPYQYFQTAEEMKLGSMSQDNAIGLIKGLALVYKCLPQGTYAHEKAREIAGKVISKIWGGGSWVILDPNQEAVPRGSTALCYAVPLTVINMAMGNPMLPSGPNAGNANISWQTLQFFGTGAENNCMTLTMAALCDCWNGSLTGQAWLNTTSGCIYQLSGQDNWDTFYLLLWEYLHDRSSPRLSLGKVEDQLMAAPCNGPYCYDSLNHVHAPNGWASTYKFEQAAPYQNHGKTGSQGNYNGLDYMLLYNLYHLINLRDGQQPIPYMDLVNRELTGVLPTCSYHEAIPLSVTYGDDARNALYDAFNTIRSDQVVDIILHPRSTSTLFNNQCPEVGSEDAGNVTYRAGERITLKTGFRAIQGSYFHAYIQPFDCDHLRSVNPDNPYHFHNETVALHSPESGQGSAGNAWDTESAYREYLSFAGEPDDSSTSGELRVFPNPSADRFTLVFIPQEQGQAEIQIRNLQGTLVYEVSLDVAAGIPANIEIPGKDFKAGAYFGILREAERVQTFRLIKTQE